MTTELPYSKPRLRTEFGAIFDAMWPRLFDHTQYEASCGGSEEVYEIKTTLPFRVRFFIPKGHTKFYAGMVYFEGVDWTYSMGWVKSVNTGETAKTHRNAIGNMERMVEDLITGKLSV
jgi:hypothetical protein